MVKGTGFFMPRSADDIALLKAQGSHRLADPPRGPHACPPHEAATTSATSAATAGSTNSTQHASPAASSHPPPKRSSSATKVAPTCGPRAVSPGLRAASWGPSSWHSAFNGSDQQFSSANGQGRPTPATEGLNVRSLRSPEPAWDLGWDQLVPVMRVGDNSSYAGSSPPGSGLLPVVSPQSFVSTTPGICNNDNLFGSSWTYSNMAAQGPNSAAGLHDVLIPLVGNLSPTTTTATATTAMLFPAPAQQQLQPAWGSPVDLNALLQLQLSLAAAQPAAAAPAAAAASGSLEVYSSAGCLASSSSMIRLFSGGLAAPGPVLDSGCFNTQQQQQPRLPDGLITNQGHSLPLPISSTQAQLAPCFELDSLSASLPGSNSMFAALHGSSSTSLNTSQPLPHQHVGGNGVAAAAAAVAQDKLAQMQQLKMLQQQLRDEVVSLLPLI